jgi:uncharacterized protein YdcH (DUF465 family)
METKESDAIDYLSRENEEYRRLNEEHGRLEQALEEIIRKRHHSEDDEVEKKRIKKEKLIKKDRMAEIIRKYKEQRN